MTSSSMITSRCEPTLTAPYTRSSLAGSLERKLRSSGCPRCSSTSWNRAMSSSRGRSSTFLTSLICRETRMKGSSSQRKILTMKRTMMTTTMKMRRKTLSRRKKANSMIWLMNRGSWSEKIYSLMSSLPRKKRAYSSSELCRCISRGTARGGLKFSNNRCRHHTTWAVTHTMDFTLLIATRTDPT